MNYTYYIADVFTNQVFSGAQIAVFPNAEGLNLTQMGLVARELNLSETVFLTHKKGVENHYTMKIFTPRGEVDFAGQTIIAAGYILAACGKLPAGEAHTAVVFEQNTGEIQASISHSEDKQNFIQFARTVSPVVDYYAPSENEIASFLGINQAHIDTKKYAARLVSCDVPYLIVPVYYYETVRNATFNFAAWSQSIAPQTAAQEILIVSPKTPYQDSDFAARLVGPNIGAHEDPPVGSAIPALAAYLCSFEHMQKGTYTFAVQRGDDKMRRSILNLEMDHKGEDTLNLRVGGEAVMVAEGTIFIPQS
ncbi:PhzF family phenazine biosynthesis protein [methanotrophic endosymbiont of Bathymodiolus puteoserpentis (Logatchev)]|jgi:trans-2,3-dihydro-3-hydroxyanthranilate isomerase|uniref:PhzF family phenazine biosynthesis protein n=1 Tax=methanotrophic endosymbiont of Bathymodiolus puteoserpentis (Logatchev) TaxID=343235 RepID=UPI0013CA66E2|nr:PhzF family phenazine biosynthesis protein [methanotrophic endosymbiont of Bathymodiolus puteoserpentis (Logatchev)]SHE21123.1 Phenazine biosynthesis protein PhzF like [methanotrophic endosymbiont of Bathymodiolus puteoserpentis (Logatchev)]